MGLLAAPRPCAPSGGARPIRRAFALGVVVVLGCVAIGLSPLGAAANSRAKKAAVAVQLRGVNLTPNWEWPSPNGMDDATSAAELRSACQLGANLVRFTVKWNRLEPTPGRMDPTYMRRIDQVMAQAGSCGARVLVTLMITPCWIARGWSGICPPGQGSLDPPRDPGAFGSIVERTLRRWPGIYALEVWNEPNLSTFFHGSPADYAALANATVDAANRTGAQTQVLVGSIAAGSVDYLNQLYDAGISGYDGISIHPYDFRMAGRRAGFSPKRKWRRHKDLFERHTKAVHRAMRARGDLSGLWLTEFGYSICPTQPFCVSERRQARTLVACLRAAARWRYVRGLTTYSLRDAGEDPNRWDNRFGLLRRDFSPRPAYFAVGTILRRLLARQGRAPKS
jgi:polysaccharide biosynthesis protein PslG